MKYEVLVKNEWIGEPYRSYATFNSYDEAEQCQLFLLSYYYELTAKIRSIN